jgi:thiamine biosynthesis lipoprotein
VDHWERSSVMFDSREASRSHGRGVSPLELQRDSATLAILSHNAMACQFQLVAPTRDSPRGAEAAIAAFEQIDWLESQISVFRPDSLISQINARAGSGQPTVVGPQLFPLFRMARDLAELTRGAFDLSAGRLARVWGFLERQPRIPAAENLAAARLDCGMQYVRLDEAASTVEVLKQGVELNPGAIGKGFALDSVVSIVERHGVADFVLDAGQSSVVARGTRPAAGGAAPRRGWPIGIVHPLHIGRRLGIVHLADRALGTSGSGRQRFVHQGRHWGHLIDPRTGWPTDHVLSATVLAPTAAEADALATAAFVGSDADIDEWCRARPDVGVILVKPSDQPGIVECVTRNIEPDEWEPLV